jgi:2,4-dienoyl-CoA reductase-like NADH-dependent reductase (Old Yellow Enzyme family)
MEKLFTSLQLNQKVTLKNRLAVAPMTTQQSNADGTISEQEIDWLERLSLDGYGLVISCAAAISKTSIAFHNQLNIGNEKGLDNLKRLAKKMNENNSVNLIQLCHAGSRTIDSLTGIKPRSAGRYEMPMIPNFETPEELTLDQINEIISDFANACEIVEKAGFQGVELHGANGYLFTQFTSKMTNTRADIYGGDLVNRARFSREVVKACRQKVSKDFVIGFRMSFENMGLETGLDIDENIQIINWLVEDGINYVHTSQMDYKANSIKYPEKNLLEYLRRNIKSSLPLIGVGGVFTYEDAEKALEYGADIVAIGRAAIGNRNLPKIFQSKENLTNHTPYEEKTLKDINVSQNLIDYLKYAPPLASLKIMVKN